MKVSLSGMDEQQTLKMRLLPGMVKNMTIITGENFVISSAYSL